MPTGGEVSALSADVSARAAEGHTLPLFPDVESAELGEWVARTEPRPSGRPVKRANSRLAMGDPGAATAAASEWIVPFYTARERPPLAQVERGSDAETSLAAAGWALLGHGDSAFQVAALPQLRRLLGPGPAAVRLRRDGVRVLAEALDGEVVIARGRAAYEADWLGVHGLWTDPANRRRGLARGVMAALAGWGAEHGSGTVWLHVETDNPAAVAPYDALGFRTHHHARYLLAPGHAWPD